MKRIKRTILKSEKLSRRVEDVEKRGSSDASVVVKWYEYDIFKNDICKRWAVSHGLEMIGEASNHFWIIFISDRFLKCLSNVYISFT